MILTRRADLERYSVRGGVSFGAAVLGHLSPLDDSRGSETLLQYGDFTEPRQ